MTITLIGYMGSGKSTIGIQLAKLLDYNYVDFDAFIEEKEDKSISDLFKTKGEIYFRKVESRLLNDVVELTNTIISLGGGTPCYGNNMQLIKSSPCNKSIYLRGTVSTLAARLTDERNHRPMIAHLTTDDELIEFIGKHLFERSQFYNQSDLTIGIDNKSVNQIVEEIEKSLF